MDINSGTNQAQQSPTAGKNPYGLLWYLALALGIAMVLVSAGCQSSHYSIDDMLDSVAVSPKTATMDYATNLLHEGDTVGITFQYSTNFNTAQKIALDGMLNLEMVGPVKASGRTLMELQQELERLYKPQVKDDVITAKLIVSGATVYVAGAVLRPGIVEMDRPLTVLEAVIEAGGFDTTRAKLSAVSVLRIANGEQQTYQVNLKKVLEGKEKSPFYLKPSDTIYVPAKTFNY